MQCGRQPLMHYLRHGPWRDGCETGLRLSAVRLGARCDSGGHAQTHTLGGWQCAHPMELWSRRPARRWRACWASDDGPASRRRPMDARLGWAAHVA